MRINILNCSTNTLQQVTSNLVLTKAHKNTQHETPKNVRSFIDTMKKEWEYIPAHFDTSTVKFLGRNEIHNYIAELNADFTNE